MSRTPILQSRRSPTAPLRMSGSLSGCSIRPGKTGEYAVAEFTYRTRSGRTAAITTMAFGTGLAKVRPHFVDGRIHLIGCFDNGVFAIIDIAAPQEPANLSQGVLDFAA